MPTIIKNVKPTKSLAPEIPCCSSFKANKPDTAAATIPRGPIQAISDFSCQVSLVPMPHKNTDSGRITNCITNSKISAGQPMANTAPISTRAASKINSAEINNTVRFSLKDKISSICTPRILAITIPIKVTVNKPDSCSMALLTVNAANTRATVP